MKLFKALYFQVLLAIIAGILLGHFIPEFAVKLKPLGDGFIKLIKLTIPPLIFCTIVLGIAGVKSEKKLGRVGIKAIIYFEIITTLALFIGLLIVNLINPGGDMHIDPEALKEPEKKAATDWGTYIIRYIPEVNIDLLLILGISIVIGFILLKTGTKGKPVLGGIDSFSKFLFKIIHALMKLAPIGALGAMSYTIGHYGFKSLSSLGWLMGSFYLTCILFIVLVLGGIMWYCKLNIFKLLRYLKDELLIVFGTSSSEPALPGLMEKMEKLGCSKPLVRLVIPTGYSLNLDGTCIYLTMAVVFLAQATDIELTLMQQLAIMATLMITSKGAAGVTGSGFIILTATLDSTEIIPVAATALLMGIDKFMSEARALTNIIGNSVATVAIAKWEKELDMETAKKELK